MRLVLGVDGGGSKTHALVADERGEVVGFASSGRSNWEDTGLEAAGAALAEAIGGALSAAQVPPGALAASALGLAGLDWGPTGRCWGPCSTRSAWPGPGSWRTTRSSPCGPAPASRSGWW
jgi:sugar (pentulose or hexulose) kinase